MSLRLTSSPSELRERFFALSTVEDVAQLLEIEYKLLVYYIYTTLNSKGYTKFTIPKKNGDIRTISAPSTGLKIVQQKLNQILQAVYYTKASVHGFSKGKNIVTNTRMHSRQRYVLNVDLKDFFPSINFGRVRGLFMAKPYGLDPAVATVLAQICCYKGALPQGAPTSPIVSNMICGKMDTQLRLLAKQHRCMYTRYADDITFSTSVSNFPPGIAYISEQTGKIEVGHELQSIIEENGFTINPSKIRLQTRDRRQEVTGLTANRFPNIERKYVREIRAMLYAWERHGPEQAAQHFFNNHDSKHRGPFKPHASYSQIVKGKIEFLGMVRGKSNANYQRFSSRLRLLAPELYPAKGREQIPAPVIIPKVFTEGKTDWKHLKAAFRTLKNAGLYTNFDIEFFEYEDDIKMGDVELKKMCEQHSKSYQPQMMICIFDNDNPKLVNQVTEPNHLYKHWKNNVYSFMIPIPDHRPNASQVSIELYYEDAEIKQMDHNGRRLFLSDEFHPTSYRHLTEDLSCGDRNKFRASVSVIDSQVYDKDHNNVALPKNDFAEYILQQQDGFANFDMSKFRKIFDVIQMIIVENQEH